MEESTLMIWCSSAKERASLGFGVSFNPEEESIDTLSMDWVWAAMSESFWENYEEFEPGIDKAKRLKENDSALSFREALKDVFGTFKVVYELDGENIELDWDLEYNEAVYYLLENQ